jgi:hypothetical protein
MNKKIRFSEINEKVPNAPGKYEIYTDSGIPLKVGIGVNLRKRLSQHYASKQSGLRLNPGGSFLNPNVDYWNPSEIISKRSVLAKHFYFDSSITSDYNLKTEEGRQRFLLEQCCFVFGQTATREEARVLELETERNGSFRYVGRVINR